jgi:hypothetical protein
LILAVPMHPQVLLRPPPSPARNDVPSSFDTSLGATVRRPAPTSHPRSTSRTSITESTRYAIFPRVLNDMKRSKWQ